MRKVFIFTLSLILIVNLLCVSAVGGNVVKGEEEITLPASFTASVENKEALSKLPVEIKAKSAVLMDVATGEVLMEYNADLKLYPASVTKIIDLKSVV